MPLQGLALAPQVWERENIHYYLDPACLEGLALFYSYGHECGVLPKAPELQFFDAGKPVIP